jgi:segregation and condensation protein A
MYKLKLQQFEGPLDLLYELIEKRKLSINEISLAEVADQYLNYLKALEKFPLREAASFLVIASTLMLIKSRSLISTLELSEEEELEIHDLEKRLRLYKEYRKLARNLERIFGKNIIFQRESFLGVSEVFIEPRGLTLFKLKDSLDFLINSFPATPIDLPQGIVKKTITLEKKINELEERLRDKIKFCFSEIKKPGCEKIEIITSFLALLELIKKGLALAKQESRFEDIEITRNEDFKP